MAPSKSAKKSAKSTSSGKTARKSTGGKGKTSGKTAADKTPAGRTTRSGGGNYATGGKSLPKKPSGKGKKATGGKKKGRSADTASRSTGGSIHKTGSRWGNGGTVADSEAVMVSSYGSPRDEEVDPNWDLDNTMEELGDDLNLDKLIYTNTMQAPFTLKNKPDKQEIIRFKIGDRIWILPDKQSGTIPAGCDKIEDLPDEYWWIGEVVNCCYLPHGDDTQGEQEHIGFLEVVWFYSYEHALKLKDTNLHSYYLNKTRDYGLEKNERILSDHRDFVPLSSYAGFADGIFARLRLHGLAMSAANRLTEARKRPKRKAGDKVWIDGFGNRKKGHEIQSSEAVKADAAQKEREQRKKEQEQKRKADPESDEEEDEEAEDEEEPSRSDSNKKRRRKSRG